MNCAEDIVTVREVAAYLKLTERAVREREARGQLKGAVRIGKSLRFRMNDIKEQMGVK